MKSLFIIIFAVAALLILPACGQKQQGDLQHNFKQGITELNVKFLPNLPPERIYPQSNFKMVLELDNQAAYDVAEGQVTILGLDPTYLQVPQPNQPFGPLLGRSFTAPSGEKAFVEFDGSAGSLIAGAEEYRAPYFLKLSYNSKMEFADTVCINPKVYQVYDAGCAVENKKSYSGQGAPLAITNLEEIISPGIGAAVDFRLELKNRGRGKVGSVTLNSAKLGNQELTCTFQGTLNRVMNFTSEQQETTLLCRTTLRDQNSYTTTVSLDFSYLYELVQQQTLNVIGPRARRTGW